MKKLTPIVALSLGACVTDPNLRTAVDARTRDDMRAYVAENWDAYQQRYRYIRAELPPGKLEFVDLNDLRCDPIADAFSCNFQVTAKTESGEFATFRGWGQFAYRNGSLAEVIIVG